MSKNKNKIDTGKRKWYFKTGAGGYYGCWFMDGDQIRARRAATPHEGRGAVPRTEPIWGAGTPIVGGKAFKRGMNTKDKGTVLGLTNQGGGKQTSPLSDRKPSPLS